MKQVILSIATMLMMGISAFAGVNDEVKVNQQAQQSFKKIVPMPAISAGNRNRTMLK